MSHAGGEDTAAPADEVGGAALRLLHQLSDCVAAAEALARTSQPPLPLLRRAMGAWGLAGRVLALETLKRALVLINRCPLDIKFLAENLHGYWRRAGRDCHFRNFASLLQELRSVGMRVHRL